MLSTIYFDDEPRTQTNEVNDVHAKGYLSAEAMLADLFAA